MKNLPEELSRGEKGWANPPLTKIADREEE
jgi:hypothetical protein